MWNLPQRSQRAAGWQAPSTRWGAGRSDPSREAPTGRLPRPVLGCLLISLLLAAGARAQEQFPTPEAAAVRHGLITWEGPSGMFINPTSATLPSGRLAVLDCVLVFEQGDERLAGHQAMIAYGFSDRIEAGVTAMALDAPSATTLRGGPFLRVKVLEAGRAPELSLGGFFREGNQRLSRATVFVAASKYIQTGGDLVRGFPLHLGLRQLWRADTDEDSLLAYVGGEIELPRGVFLVGEVSNRSDAFERTPFSFGLQVRRPDGFGFSLAGVQTGDQDQLGVLVGIGISFGR